MVDPVAPPLTLAELERIVREADPAALLVPPRILRRVIKADRGLTFLGWHGAHRESYAIAGTALRRIVEAHELGLPSDARWPETLLLLAPPDSAELAETPRGTLLTRYWRKVFHSRVHATLERRIAAGALTAEDVRARIERIGRLEFEEARSVLRQDGRLLPPRDDRGVYCEFAAVFLELRHFAPALLPHEFPCIKDPTAIETVLADDVDGPALVAATRPSGAPGPVVPSTADERADDTDDFDATEIDETEPPENRYRRFAHRAEAAAQRGNFARAAILWTQAAFQGGPALVRRARAAARNEIDRLTRRLQAALGFNDAELDRWKRALPRLLDRSACGFWTAEARLLYDLQKVANDHEHEIFTVDLVEWIRSRGRRPLKRALPHMRAIMISNHLHRAARRLPATRLNRDARERLSNLLNTAVARVEHDLRDRYRPVVSATLAENGFHSRNLPEHVAHDKIVEELLDRILGRGFLTLGDLRDACSRSHLKLPNLSGPSEFLRGDRLLRTDAALAEALDGVYRRGEVYLRGLQRMSSLAFGTPWGRFLTLFLVLPFGGTFVGLKGLAHLIELFGVDVDLVNPLALIGFGTLALALINSPRFRGEFLAALRRIVQTVGVSAATAWRWLARQPWVRAVVESPLFAVAWRRILKPLALSVPFYVLGALAGFSGRTLAQAEIGLLVLMSVLVNSRLGRDAEEIAAESAARLWKRLWLDLIPGLFRWVLMVFQQFLEGVERVLYAVDEWLRFRSGQRRESLVVKAVLGFIWFFIAYLVRIYVNLLIEPQVNPIKHFPVVTVSHKIILPLSKTLTFLIAAPLMPLGGVVAYFIAGTTVLLLPGVFGFLVWEMKENWRLYEANRPESLRPVIVGSHGETMSRLLRPGFHSGTVPKLFARLRRAERRVLEGKHDDGIPKRLDALHHVEQDVERFLDRDFLGLLRGCHVWESAAPTVHEIELATNRIRVRLRLRHEADDLELALEEDSGVLSANVSEMGWLARLPETRRRACALALLGLCEMSGTGSLRLPLEVLLAPAFDAVGASQDPDFLEVEVSWKAWVETWERFAHCESDDGAQPTTALIFDTPPSATEERALEGSEPLPLS